MPHLRGAPALQRRQASMGDANSNTAIFLGIGGAAVAIIIVLFALYALRQRRMNSADLPGWVPSFLRNRWSTWQPKQSAYGSAGSRNGSSIGRRAGLGAGASSLDVRSSSDAASALAHESELDRRQSVRSILTLPPYNVAPLPSERLIAREGERAGIDTVVDLPETETEVEGRREDEMQALFNVREARRRETAERDDRREQRRLARERNDWARLEQLEQESRDRARQRARDEQLLSTLEAAQRGRSPGGTSQQLIAELTAVRDANARSRRVSSVSYAELGLARHDGSRLRGDSVESSDHRPLLDSAASFGSRSRAVSRAGSDTGAALSIGSGARSRTASVTRPPPSHQRHASGGAASFLSDDDHRPPSAAQLPLHPPSYDDDASVHGGDAPPYEAPAEHAPPANAESSPGEDTPPSSSSGGPAERMPPSVMPALARLQTDASAAPAVEVTSATPINSVPHTPVNSHGGPEQFRWELSRS